jgi:hypothetical protein
MSATRITLTLRQVVYIAHAIDIATIMQGAGWQPLGLHFEWARAKA